MAPKAAKNRRLLGDSFLKSGKFSYSQNDLENPLGEAWLRSQQSQFPQQWADCCQVCRLGHVIKKQTSYFHRFGLCFYIKRLSLCIWNTAAAERWTQALEANRKQQREQKIRFFLVSTLGTGTLHGTLGLMKQTQLLYCFFGTTWILNTGPKGHLTVLSKKMILHINQKNAYIKVFH